MANMVDRARELAYMAHDGQLRDGGKPYIVHPEAVVNLLRELGCINDPEILAVAWLHDLVEDTAYTLEYVRKQFGKNVAFGVWLLTDDITIKQHKRKSDTINRLKHYTNNKFSIIKLADRLSNLDTMSIWKPKRQYKYALGGLGILWAVSSRLAPKLWDTLFVTVCTHMLPGVTNDLVKTRVCGICGKHRKTWWSGRQHYCVFCMRNLGQKRFSTLRWFGWLLLKSWRG